MLIPREAIQEIKNRLDIIQIIGEYVSSLKRSGKNWVGLCPFHNDKHPSMNVSPELGIFKCFSCGEGGDIIGFVQKIENVSFTESVELLAKRAGIHLNLTQNIDSQEYQKKDELLQFNNRLIKLFQHFLLERPEGKKAQSYLEQRGITDDLVKTFGIGYAPRDYNKLSNFFFKKGFKEDFLINSGLFSKGDRGLKPLFFDRVMFPIINQKEECIGFGGRALSDEAKPKYINTPETAAYKKSYNLYGINIGKNIIRKEKKAYLVEGYLDVISCYKNGIKNVVAPCGTAVTRDQMQLLKRYSEEIILFFDGDDAGKKGAEKALRESANILVKITVLLMPDGMDPDDYFAKHSLDDFRELEKNRLEGFDFLVKYWMKDTESNKNDIKGLLESLNRLFEYINLWESEVVRNSLIERLAELIQKDKGMIAREFITFRKKKRTTYNKREEEEQEEKTDILNELTKREIDLILFLMMIDDPIDTIKKCGLREEHFQNDYLQELFRHIFIEKKVSNTKEFVDLIKDEKIKEYVHERSFSDEFKFEMPVLRNNVIDRISDIIKKYFLKINDEINEKIKLGELYKDIDLVRELQEEKSAIINEIVKLSNLQEYKK